MFFTDKDLEKLLCQSSMIPPSPDLAQRILRQALMIPQQTQMTMAQAVQRIFAEFRMPQPAYALATLLLIGFAMGCFMQSPAYASAHSQKQITIANFLYADEVAL